MEAIIQSDCSDEARTGGRKSLFRILVGKTSFYNTGLQMTWKVSEGKAEKGQCLGGAGKCTSDIFQHCEKSNLYVRAGEGGKWGRGVTSTHNLMESDHLGKQEA